MNFNILIKKEENFKLLESDAKKRRQSSEKSISVLTNSDLQNKKSAKQLSQKRTDRKKLHFNNIEDFE